MGHGIRFMRILNLKRLFTRRVAKATDKCTFLTRNLRYFNKKQARHQHSIRFPQCTCHPSCFQIVPFRDRVLDHCMRFGGKNRSDGLLHFSPQNLILALIFRAHPTQHILPHSPKVRISLRARVSQPSAAEELRLPPSHINQPVRRSI